MILKSIGCVPLELIVQVLDGGDLEGGGDGNSGGSSESIGSRIDIYSSDRGRDEIQALEFWVGWL